MSDVMASMASLNRENSLEETVAQFLDEDKLTDVTFKVKCGDDWVFFKAHKVILCMWSPVLADLFFGPNPIQQDPVEVTDVSPEVFRTMLRFAYGGVCNLDNHRDDIPFFVKVFRASQAYQIQFLSIVCVQHIERIQPTKHNVFQLLEATRLMPVKEELETEERCINLLETETAAVLASLDLCEVTLKMVQTILDLDEDSFESVLQLIIWLFAWAKNEELKPGNTRSFKDILKNKDVLGRVDLTRMEASEFGELLRLHEGVFDNGEIAKIFRNIVDPGCCQMPDWVGVVGWRVFTFKNSKVPVIFEF